MTVFKDKDLPGVTLQNMMTVELMLQKMNIMQIMK